jgi:predicted cation transporter
MFVLPRRDAMIHELVSAFAGLVLIQVTVFIVGDALGLLGERFAKTKVIVNWMAEIPEILVGYFFSSTTKHHYRVHLPSKH